MAQQEQSVIRNPALPPRTAAVAVVRCPSYEAEALSRAVRQSLDLLGGAGAFLVSGARVFVKINHLSPHAPPERAICTHPAFLREVLRLLLEKDVRVTVGDDVNFGPGDEFLTTGFRQVCAEMGVPLVNLRQTGFTEVPIAGALLDSVYIARPVLEADLVLNLPKLKTHSLTVFTGAVKNLYGTIPYGLRLDGHRRFGRNDLFSRMLVDVFSAIPRQFTIMDAVIGMGGEGPSSGVPKEIGLIIAGEDGVAVDAVASSIIGHDPLQVVTTSEAHKRNLGLGDLERIQVIGESLARVRVRDFRPSLAASRLFRRRLPSRLYAFVSGKLILTPEIIREKCTACLECLTVCPARTIHLVRDAVWVDEAGCIHCLCCHEVCVQRSIRLKQRPLGRMIRGMSRLSRKMKTIGRAK
jgi:uncharacterized protein (DUF362 family)/Pyruvate/2-oxoacid:ferredoxin oxidoreductase delta subunit